MKDLYASVQLIFPNETEPSAREVCKDELSRLLHVNLKSAGYEASVDIFCEGSESRRTVGADIVCALAEARQKLADIIGTVVSAFLQGNYRLVICDGTTHEEMGFRRCSLSPMS